MGDIGDETEDETTKPADTGLSAGIIILAGGWGLLDETGLKAPFPRPIEVCCAACCS